MREEGLDELIWSRRLRACLAVARGYLVLVVLGLLLRIVAHYWGLILSRYALGAAQEALIVHTAALVLVAGGLVVVRRRAVQAPWAARLALAVLPILFLVSLDRLIVVWYRPQPSGLDRFDAHPTRLWTHRAGWVERHGDVTVRINSRGLRGPEVPYEKSPGKRRVLFLGDSVPFGYRVNEEDCLVWKLPELAASRLTVVNASVQGYSPWQEYDLLRSEGLRYDPDVVVQVFCPNDVLDKYQLVPFGGKSLGHRPTLRSPLDWSGLYRMFHAARNADRWLAHAEMGQIALLYSYRRLVQEPDAPDVQRAWRITLENMGKITALAHERKLRLMIVFVPHSDQVLRSGPNMTLIQERLAAFAEEAGVPFLDLLPAYRETLHEQDLEIGHLFVDPLHLTPQGHEIAAKRIYQFLVDLGWLP